MIELRPKRRSSVQVVSPDRGNAEDGISEAQIAEMTMWPFTTRNINVSGSIYGLFVGINAYPLEEEIGNLEFGSADAIDLHGFFAKHTSPENLKLLTQNEDNFGFVTSSQVIKALNDFSSRQFFKEEDIFLFFFAGHAAHIGNRFYLLTSDSKLKPDEIDKCSLPIETLKNHIDRISTGKQVLIIDACREYYRSRSTSGKGMDKAMHEMLENLARRIKPQEEYQYDILRAIVSSCWIGKLSWEYRDGAHGWFTYHLLKCLETDEGEFIDLGALVTAVKHSMRRDKTKLPPASTQKPHLLLDGEQIFLPTRGRTVRINYHPAFYRFATFVLYRFAPWTVILLGVGGAASLVLVPGVSYTAGTVRQTPTNPAQMQGDNKVEQGGAKQKSSFVVPPGFVSEIARAKHDRGRSAYFEACQKYAVAFSYLPDDALTDSDQTKVAQADKCGLGGSKEIVEQLDEIADKVLAKRRVRTLKVHH